MAGCYGGFGVVELPNGGCGFRDLGAGVKAPTCGCRRFWLNNSSGPVQDCERAWCFCGHHACFHDNIVNPFTPRPQTVPPLNVFPSALQANAATLPGAQPAPTWSELIATPTNASGNDTTNACRPNTGLGITNPSQPPSQSPSINTRVWNALNGFARNQHNFNGGCSGDTSKIPSTVAPSLASEPVRRPSPSRELRARMEQNQQRPMAPPVNIPAAQALNRTDDYSATEVATPSIRGTPDSRGAMLAAGRHESPARGTAARASDLQALDTTSRRAQAQGRNTSDPERLPLTSNGPSLSIQEMCNTIQDFGRRISSLESVSFQQMPSDQLHDRFELQEGRLLDLEHWRVEQDRGQDADDTQERLNAVDSRVVELESWRNEQERLKTSQETDEAEERSSSRNRSLLRETESFASDMSDENAAAQTENLVLATLAAHAELSTDPRINNLEARISALENASLPSPQRPWHVQVVILPFGQQLPGIWFSSSESSRHSIRSATQASEEWSGHQNLAKASFASAASSGAWTTESIEAWAKETQNEWLSPKACGPTGTVFQRLASRGLVRNVALRQPDARHIFSTIESAFEGVLRHGEKSVTTTETRYHGLLERFIPLRKVRKSTRLRFLSQNEMVTPSTWTAEFLECSVFMKVNDGERRLYLTTADAYTQTSATGWSWPALKDMPMVDMDGEPHAAQISTNVVEACWTYNDRLDHPASAQSSFAQQHESPWGIPSEEDGFDAVATDVPMPSPSTTRKSIVRSSSLPETTSSAAVAVSQSTKRRVASFEHEPIAHTVEYSPEYVSKRQRTSASPELERRGVNFTPRWSPAEDIGLGASRSSSNRVRGTTPFAYPTPHSHLDSRGGDFDGDTEVDVYSQHGSDEPEEWNGVQDGDADAPQKDHEADCIPEEVHVQRLEEVIHGLYGEDDLEDGLTIYEV